MDALVQADRAPANLAAVRPKVTARDVNVYYGEKHALKNVSIDIPENSVTAFIGPSGCGKSTFLRCINRMNDTIPIARVTGLIELDGRDIYEKNGYRVMRLGVHMTVTTKNLDVVDAVKAYCADDIYFDCDHVAPVGIALDNPRILGTPEDYELCVRTSRRATSPMVLTTATCGKSSCSLFYFGLAIGYEGEVMVDTHAIETKHVVGHIKDAPLPDLLRRAQKLRDGYFADFGNHPCIIRNPRYREYLAYLDDVREAEGRYPRRRRVAGPACG